MASSPNSDLDFFHSELFCFEEEEKKDRIEKRKERKSEKKETLCDELSKVMF